MPTRLKKAKGALRVTPPLGRLRLLTMSLTDLMERADTEEGTFGWNLQLAGVMENFVALAASVGMDVPKISKTGPKLDPMPKKRRGKVAKPTKFRSVALNGEGHAEGAYVQVYQRPDMKQPIADLNFFEGERSLTHTQQLHTLLGKAIKQLILWTP